MAAVLTASDAALLSNCSSTGPKGSFSAILAAFSRFVACFIAWEGREPSHCSQGEREREREREREKGVMVTMKSTVNG